PQSNSATATPSSAAYQLQSPGFCHIEPLPVAGTSSPAAPLQSEWKFRRFPSTQGTLPTQGSSGQVLNRKPWQEESTRPKICRETTSARVVRCLLSRQ